MYCFQKRRSYLFRIARARCLHCNVTSVCHRLLIVGAVIVFNFVYLQKRCSRHPALETQRSSGSTSLFNHLDICAEVALSIAQFYYTPPCLSRRESEVVVYALLYSHHATPISCSSWVDLIVIMDSTLNYNDTSLAVADSSSHRMQIPGQDGAQVIYAGTSPNWKPENQIPGLVYRDEYRYGDGELAKFEEKNIMSELSSNSDERNRNEAFIKIITVYMSNTPEKAADKKQVMIDATLPTSESKKHSSLPEEFEGSSVASRTMVILSRKLINALRDVISYYPGTNLPGEKIEIEEPYRLLVHHQHELRAYKDKHPKYHDNSYREECNQHIDTLLKFLDQHSGKAVRDEMDRWERDPPICTFEHLWLLYKPGEACYHENRAGHWNPYITKVIYGGLTGKILRPYEVEAWNIKFDGFELGRCVQDVWIAPFNGEKEIRSLKYYPERFHIEEEELNKRYHAKNSRERFVARGKKYWNLTKHRSCYRDYNGTSAMYPYKEV